MLLANTVWQGGGAGDFGVDANWTLGAPGVGDNAIFNTGGGVAVSFANAEDAAVIDVQANGMGAGTKVTFDLGQKEHKFRSIAIRGTGSALTLSNGTVRSFLGNQIINKGATLTVDDDASHIGEGYWRVTGTVTIEGSVNIPAIGPLASPGTLYVQPEDTTPGSVTINGGIAEFSRAIIGGSPGGAVDGAKVTVTEGGTLDFPAGSASNGEIRIGTEDGHGYLYVVGVGDSLGDPSTVSGENFLLNDQGGRVYVNGGASLFLDHTVFVENTTDSSIIEVTDENSSIVSSTGHSQFLSGDVNVQDSATFRMNQASLIADSSANFVASGLCGLGFQV